jgi:flagellum-specific ATP synthase
MPLRELSGISVGDQVIRIHGFDGVGVGHRMLGRVVNGLGEAIDGGGSIIMDSVQPIDRRGPGAMQRCTIDEPLTTGVRSIDACLTIGMGQRMGIFAGTGVGKSMLMGMIARNTSADVNVVALVGERGREVGDFLNKSLGKEGLARSVVVVSTSDESPVLRVRACFLATTIAEYFRDQGKHVLLMMDSVTRMAQAQRQIGLAAGEPPTTKGFPPSVFGLLPRLLERSGRMKHGSITGLFTVLVEGDDLNEPISDAMRGILDGHIWLSRELANRGHFPAVSVLESVSRVMPDVSSQDHKQAAQSIRKILAAWRDVEDIVNLGAYVRGANVDSDIAVAMKKEIDDFLIQPASTSSPFEQSVQSLISLARKAETRHRSHTQKIVKQI